MNKHRNPYQQPTGELFTTAELHARNLNKSKINKMLKQGELFRLFRGMYATCTICPNIIARALVKVRPDLVFTGKTALEIYHDQPLTFPLEAQVNDRSFCISMKKYLRLRRTRTTHRSIHNHLPVVPLAHAIAGIIEEATTENINLNYEYPWAEIPDDLELHLLHPDSVVPAKIIETFEKYYAGKQGNQLLNTHLNQLKASRNFRHLNILEHFITHVAVAGTDSKLEIKCVLAMRKAGFCPTTQAEVGPYRWDLGIEELNLVIDIDSERYHQHEEEAFYADRWKTNDTLLFGKNIMRITGSCYDHHFNQIILRLTHLRSMSSASTKPSTKPKTSAKAIQTQQPITPPPEIQPAWRWHKKLKKHPV